MAERPRLSPLDAAFLYFERPNQLLHVGCVALFDGPMAFDRLAVTLAERLEPLRRYRQRPVRPLLDLDRPRWQDDAAFDAQRHIRHVAVPSPGDLRALRALIDTLFATPFDPSHPLWEMYLIDGLAEGRTALLTKVHHCMIDGVSGAQILELITDGAGGGGGENGGGAGRPGDPAAAGPLRATLRTLIDPMRLWGHAREAIEASSILASLAGGRIPPLPFNGRLSDARRIVWADFSLDDFLAIRGISGCKVNDVVLAVIAGALRRYLVSRGFDARGLAARALVPVSVRGDGDRLALGNLVSAMFAELPLDAADPRERLRHIAEEMRALKERGQPRGAGLLMTLAGVLPAPFAPLLARLTGEHGVVNTVCTNVAGPRETRHLLGRRLVEVHPIVPLFMGVGLGFAILSYGRRISITANADAGLVPDAEALTEHLVASEAELRAALLGEKTSPIVSMPDGGPTIAELMTSEVLVIAPWSSLADAHRLMRLRRIRHLPVVEHGRLVGLVTHRDVLAASTSSLLWPSEELRGRLLAGACASDVMETHLSTVAPQERAAEAGLRMVRHKIGCLPVVERDGRLVGIVTEEDFLRWATERMQAVG